jgi:hypothetical protein
MSGGSSVQQLLQLVKKNFIVKARNRRATLYEFLFVVYFLGIVIFLVKITSNQLSEYPSLPSLPLVAPAPLGISRQATNLTYLYFATPPHTPAQYLPQWCAPPRRALSKSNCFLASCNLKCLQVIPRTLMPMPPPVALPFGLCVCAQHVALHLHRDFCDGKASS